MELQCQGRTAEPATAHLEPQVNNTRHQTSSVTSSARCEMRDSHGPILLPERRHRCARPQRRNHLPVSTTVQRYNPFKMAINIANLECSQACAAKTKLLLLKPQPRCQTPPSHLPPSDAPMAAQPCRDQAAEDATARPEPAVGQTTPLPPKHFSPFRHTLRNPNRAFLLPKWRHRHPGTKWRNYLQMSSRIHG